MKGTQYHETIRKTPREKSVTKFCAWLYYSLKKAMGRHSQACKDSRNVKSWKLSLTNSAIQSIERSFQLRTEVEKPQKVETQWKIIYIK